MVVSVYVVPQTLIYEDFNLIPQASSQPQPAHISGGHAYLQRYDVADEKNSGLLGTYDPTSDTAYSWPGRPAGGLVDTTYTRVFIDDALLQYFSDPVDSGSTIATVAGYPNRVRSSTLSFAANGTSYPHSATLKDRGVRVGDTVKLTCTVSDVAYTLWSYVSGFVAETVAAVTGTATADAANASTQVAPSTTYTQASGAVNCVEITGASATAYNGLATGNLNETYTISVVTGGPAASAVLRVRSASGNDDVASVTPSAFGVATAIGANGLTVTWNTSAEHECSLSSFEAGVAQDEFIAGQTWTVSCGQAFASPTITAAGTYAGTSDCVYLIEVTKGGLWAAGPQISVRTNRGTELSGPTTVAISTPATVGVNGVTIAFSGASVTGLRKGDRFSIAATAAKAGAYQTITLGNNLPTAVISNGATNVGLTLYIRKNIEVNKNRLEAPPNVNWSQSETQITLKSGITAQDSTWTDNGVPESLSVVSDAGQGYGQAYVTYRAWLSTFCGGLYNLASIGDIDTVLPGALHPDNPLKWGVYLAATNANGLPVYFTSVCNPDDLDSWTTVLSVIEGHKEVYGIVPLTRDHNVWNLYIAHVLDQSAAEKKCFRELWLNGSVDAAYAKVDATTSTDEDDVLATVEDDPFAAGTQYTLLKIPAKNGQFVTNKVAPGDIVRINYNTDGFDGITYDEYQVDSVLNEDSLRLLTGPAQPISSAEKIEVWHTRTLTEEATEWAKTGGTKNRRVIYVCPDEVSSGGLTFAGYFLCAALAAEAGGVSPHQSLTRAAISGFDDVSRATRFSYSQLNTMAGNGVWIVTQDPVSGSIYTRHAVTTAPYADIYYREEMVTRNVDNICFYFDDLTSPYIGVSNVTPSAIDDLYATVQAGCLELMSRNYIRRLGPQLITATITECRAHTVLRDRVVVSVSGTIPIADNNIEFHFVV